MRGLLQDIRFGIRLLLRNPGVSIAAILCLGLGIGATTAVFSVANGVILRPLPYREPENLAMLFSRCSEQWKRMPTSGLNYIDLQEQNHSFEEMAVCRYVEQVFQHEDGSEELSGMCISPNLFSLLGQEALIGRTFLPEETWPNHHSIILGHSFWKRRFGSRESAIGETVVFGEIPYTIVGVMPPGVQYLNTSSSTRTYTEVNAFVDFWIPVDIEIAEVTGGGRGRLRWDVVGRLKPGINLEQAQSDIDRIVKQIVMTSDYAATHKAQMAEFGVDVIPLHTHIVGETRPLVLLLLASSCIVLLIACVNVANLLIAEGLGRRKEIAMRAALGASLSRLVRQLMTESVLLAFLGGVCGLFLSSWGVGLFKSIAPENMPRVEEIAVDPIALGFGIVLSLLTGIGVGIVPVFAASNPDLSRTLKTESGGATAGRSRKRLVNGLVVSEIALSLVLLIGAGLLINSFSRLLLIDPGYKTENILTMKVENLREQEYFDLLERAQSAPGAKAAALGYNLPMLPEGAGSSINPEGIPKEEIDGRMVHARIVSPDYFNMFGISLLEGREFGANDFSGSFPVAIVNERLAQRYWSEQGSVGRRFHMGWCGTTFEIVGVAKNTKNNGLDAEPEWEAYLCAAQLSGIIGKRGCTLAVATNIEPEALIVPLTKEMWSINRNAVVSKIQTVDQIVDSMTAGPRFLTTLAAIFSFAALILAMIGLYGVMARSVVQRAHEFGVRSALGARPVDILAMVLIRGLKLVTIGSALGLLAGFAFTRLIASQLYGITPADPGTYGAMTLLLAAVAILACYIPARRAAKTDPMKVLRAE